MELTFPAISYEEAKQIWRQIQASSGPNSKPEKINSFDELKTRLAAIEAKAMRKLKAQDSQEDSPSVCSFCGKNRREVENIIQSLSGAAICNECLNSFKGGSNKDG